MEFFTFEGMVGDSGLCDQCPPTLRVFTTDTSKSDPRTMTTYYLTLWVEHGDVITYNAEKFLEFTITTGDPCINAKINYDRDV